VDTKSGSRLHLTIFYESPWERASAFFLGIRRDPAKPLRWDIPMNPTGWRKLFGWISAELEKRDRAWISRYAASGKKPHSRWRR
jgi:hypothetical protein